MPYKLGKSSQCPVSKPHAVLRDDGSLVPGGCHKTPGQALAHQRALMVNVPDATQKTKAPKAGARAIEEDITVPDILSDPRASRAPRDVLAGIVAAADPEVPTVRCPNCGNVVNQPPEACPHCNYDLTNVKVGDEVEQVDDTEPGDKDADDEGMPTANTDPAAETASQGRNIIGPDGRHIYVPPKRK